MAKTKIILTRANISLNYIVHLYLSLILTLLLVD